jgi:hypothetical protein
MVEVGVCEQEDVQVLEPDRERVPVPFEIGPLLIEPAVDEAADAAAFEEIARSRDLPGRPEECEFHHRPQ